VATILLTWELGGGIGHLMNLRPIGAELVRRGHRVVAALRDLTHAGAIFEGSGIAFVPAPLVAGRRGPRYDPICGFGQILGNVGFAEEAVLTTLLSSWQTLLDLVQPDLVVADHSPSALLALRGRPIPRVNVGLGFFCPPDSRPLPIWVPPEDPLHRQAAQDEEAITATVNRVLEKFQRPKLARLGEIFGQVDEVVLATYREFDHFGPRPQLRYWGHWPFGTANPAPSWPAGAGPKVYAYLKPYPGLEVLLTALQAQHLPTLIFAPAIVPALQARFADPCLRFTHQPVDLQQAAAQCDLAVVQAGHGTAAGLLLAGKPCLLIPLHLEQLMFAHKAAQTGAARVLGKEAEAPAAEALQDLLTNDSYRRSAQNFAQRYRPLVPGSQIGELANHLEALCRRPRLRLAAMPLRGGWPLVPPPAG